MQYGTGTRFCSCRAHQDYEEQQHNQIMVAELALLLAVALLVQTTLSGHSYTVSLPAPVIQLPLSGSQSTPPTTYSEVRAVYKAMLSLGREVASARPPHASVSGKDTRLLYAIQTTT
jgi:hypothetical protein